MLQSGEEEALSWTLIFGVLCSAALLSHQTAEDTLSSARAALRKQDWNGAEPIVLGVLKKTPDNPEALSLLGRVRVGQHRPADAVPVLQRALELAPGSLEALVELATAFQDLGRPNEARALIEKASKTASAEPDLLYRLGEASFRQGLYPEAIRALEQARSLDSANPRYAFLLATSRFAHGDSAGTIRLLEEVAGDRPEDPYAQFSLGYYLHKVGRYGEAVKRFQRALALAPELIDAKFYLARITESEGDAARAQAAYRDRRRRS
jgi:predicted Zn-dependent protease